MNADTHKSEKRKNIMFLLWDLLLSAFICVHLWFILLRGSQLEWNPLAHCTQSQNGIFIVKKYSTKRVSR